MWPGLEPLQGEYNHTYPDKYDEIVKKAAEYGIYTLIDGHQDAFNEYFCGEGVPDWARVTPEEGGEHNLMGSWPLPVADPTSDFYNEPKMNNYSFPTRDECSHSHTAEFQAAKESSYAYDALYTNVNGAGDAWADMWEVVAERFQGRSEVLGYELLNEPFMGDFYRDPLIAVPYPNPHNADAKRLQPAYDRLHASIRKQDNETLVFFAGSLGTMRDRVSRLLQEARSTQTGQCLHFITMNRPRCPQPDKLRPRYAEPPGSTLECS